MTGDRLADGVTPVGEIDLDRLLLRFPHAVVAIGRPVIADVYQRVDMLERRRSFFLDSSG